MNQLPRIGDIMATDLVTFRTGDELLHAVNILLNRRISGACVLDENDQLVGVLSKKDCLRAALNASYYQEWGGSVADYMSTEPQVLDPDTDLLEAASLFLASAYRRFPVVREGVLVGQVSRADLLRALAEQWR